MEATSLELKVISCKDLKAFNFFQKLSVYAVISVVTEDDLKNKRKGQKHNLQRQKTPVDRDGNRNPEWNHEMSFDLKELSLDAGLFLKFKLRCDGKVIPNKTIGEVCVPFKDLINEFNGNGNVRFVSYQVRTPADGKPNGVLNFCYKVNRSAGMPTKKDSPESGASGGEKHNPAVTREVENLTPAIQFPVEKVCYPSVEVVDYTTPGICYPLSEISVASPENLKSGLSEEVRHDHSTSSHPPARPPMATYWAWYPPPPPPPPPPILVQSSAPKSYYFHDSSANYYYYGLLGCPTIDGSASRSTSRIGLQTLDQNGFPFTGFMHWGQAS